MIRRSSQPLVVWFLTCDLAVTAVAWVGAYGLRFSGWFPIQLDQPTFSLCLNKLPLVIDPGRGRISAGGSIPRSPLRRFREEIVAVVKGVALVTLLVMASTFYTHDHYESRGTMALFTGLSAVGMLSCRRATWGWFVDAGKRGLNQTHALIVGTGRVARKTARALRHASWMGIRNVGFVEDSVSRWAGDLNVLGTTADLPDLVAKHHVEHVFIALPLNRHAEARRVFDVLSQSLVEVRLVLDVPNLAGLSLTTANLDGMPVIGLRESPHFGLNIVVQAGDGCDFGRRRPDRPVAAVGLDRRRGQADKPRPDVLSPGTLRLERRVVSDAQVSHDASRRRSANRPGLGDQGRPAANLARRPSCGEPAWTSCRS